MLHLNTVQYISLLAFQVKSQCDDRPWHPMVILSSITTDWSL